MGRREGLYGNETPKYIAGIENVSWKQENLFELTNLRLELEQLESLEDEIITIVFIMLMLGNIQMKF